MSYVDKNLMDGEQVVYRTRRHWIIFGWALLVLLIGIASFVIALIARRPGQWDIARGVGFWFVSFGVFALTIAIRPWMDRMSSEFAVTNKRVIVKVGWIQRRSIETLLTKIEAIEVFQEIWGRIFNYGTIIVIGTGGTKEPVERIAAPLEFRRKVQEQILAMNVK